MAVGCGGGDMMIVLFVMVVVVVVVVVVLARMLYVCILFGRIHIRLEIVI